MSKDCYNRVVKTRLLVVAAALALSACDTYHFLAGTMHEDARRPAKALRHYEAFLAGRPKDPRACEVRLRAAELYRRVLGRCGEARAHYEAAARDFPKMTACVERATNGLLSCPDMFPLEAGRTWVFVDSASQGRAMRLELEARPAKDAAGAIMESLFAGDRRISTKTSGYDKRDWAVWRLEGAAREPILRYPYTPGLEWTYDSGPGKERRRVEYLIVADDAVVKTAAGEFRDCVKVREKDLRYPKAWKYEYYCPGVGRVKTSVGGPGGENPNAELLRYGKL